MVRRSKKSPRRVSRRRYMGGFGELLTKVATKTSETINDVSGLNFCNKRLTEVRKNRDELEKTLNDLLKEKEEFEKSKNYVTRVYRCINTDTTDFDKLMKIYENIVLNKDVDSCIKAINIIRAENSMLEIETSGYFLLSL